MSSIVFKKNPKTIWVIEKSVQVCDECEECYNHKTPIGFVDNEEKAQEITNELAQYLQNLEDKLNEMKHLSALEIEKFIESKGFTVEEFGNLNGYTYRPLNQIEQVFCEKEGV